MTANKGMGAVTTEMRREAQRLLSGVKTLKPSKELSADLEDGLTSLVRQLEAQERYLSDEAWDEADTGITAVQEQEQTHLENLAKLIGTYYHSLTGEGLPEGLVFHLVDDYQSFSFSRWMDEANE